MEGKKNNTPNASKLYELSFEHRPQYLYAYVCGEHDSYEISKKYWQEVADECQKTGYKKVLIDEDISANVSITEIYEFASEIPKMGFQGIRVAFFDRYHLEQQEINSFGETVATNRGLFSRIFTDFDEAEKWLLSE